MSGLYSPILNILRDWRSTASQSFQTLRRINFVVEDTFEWADFDPQTTFSGMTVTLYLTRNSRYLKLKNCLWFSLHITATLAGAFSPNVFVTLPATAAGMKDSYQAGYISIQVGATVAEAGKWSIKEGTNQLALQRTGAVNYAAGACEWILTGCIEVL